MRCFRGPAGEIGGTKIGRVEFGSCYLDDAVDATDAACGRILALPSRQVSRAVNEASSAIAKGDALNAMPLAVTDLTNSRREILELGILVDNRPR